MKTFKGYIKEKLTFTKSFYKSGMGKKQKAEFDKLYKELDGGPAHQKIKRKIKNPVKADDYFHAYVMKKVIGEPSPFDESGELIERIAGYKPHTGPNATLAYHLPKQLKSMQAFLNLVQKHPKVKNVDQEKLKAGGRVVFKTFYKTDPKTQAELMKELDKLEKKFNEFNGQTNESLNEAIDHPAYINVVLQDFAKHMKRIKPHAKKAGTKLTVQGKDVRVDGLATAIKKMFDFMTSDGKGFYE